MQQSRLLRATSVSWLPQPPAKVFIPVMNRQHPPWWLQRLQPAAGLVYRGHLDISRQMLLSKRLSQVLCLIWVAVPLSLCQGKCSHLSQTKRPLFSPRYLSCLRLQLFPLALEPLRVLSPFLAVLRLLRSRCCKQLHLLRVAALEGNSLQW